MGSTVAHELKEFGQSVWLDNITRSLIRTGKLKGMIDLGLCGMTSNPTIFDKAVSSGDDYKGQIGELCKEGKTTFEIYDELTIKDIQDAADTFVPVWKKSKGQDGYVSLEINPKLAYETTKTIEEGKRLHKKVDRPNVMFKVPSTKEGFPAIEELTSYGININITLIFSVQQYIDTAHAYMSGIKRLIENGNDPSKVFSVASIFVSRIDTACDKLLDEKGNTMLKGKAAVANSKLIYKEFLNIFTSDKFKKLREKGANIQRVLWGSTSTKNPAYSDIKYVTELIAKNTVNTMPDNTFDAFLDHGKVKEAITANASDAQKIIDDLKDVDIDINSVCGKLLEDGVIAFEKSFDSLLNTIEKKKKEVYSVKQE